MENKRKKGSLRLSFINTAILPLIVVGIVIMSVTYSRLRVKIYDEIEEELANAVHIIVNGYDTINPGEYEVYTSNNISILKKGDSYIENNFADKVKNDTGMDVTIFFNDVRMLTTIQKDGNRILGTKMNSVMKSEVLEKDVSKFYTKVIIDKNRYFGYYMPIHNKTGEVIGAVGVIKSASEVNKLIGQSVIPLFIIIIAGTVISVVFILLYFKKIDKSFNQIGSFLREVENGNLKAEMNTEVCGRNDEIGNIALATVEMQKSLRSLVEKDALTKLYNRRFCNERLKVVSSKSEANGTSFSICICDIDFFKKVNDTYGHDAGDLVLVTVANTLKRFMNGKGFVARWGGEEFLIVFERQNLEEAESALNQIREEIATIDVCYGEQIIKVTMSFGVANGYGIKIEDAIKNADDRLYYAKEHGRNRVVSHLD